MAYFTTWPNNGPTEAINAVIGLHRRLARGYRRLTNYPSACSEQLAAGGLNT